MAEAGTVWVTVVPSLKGFSTKMKAALKGEDLGVQVTAKIDPKQVAAEAKKATAGVSATIEIDADIAVAKTKIAEVERNLGDLKRTAAADTPQLDLDIAAARAKAAKLTADLEKLRTLDASPEVDLKVATAEQQLGRVNTELTALQGRKVTPEVTAQIAAAEADLARFRADLDRLEARRAEVTVDADTGPATRGLDALKLRLETWTSTTATKKINVDTGDSIIKLGLLTSALQKVALPAGIVAATPYLLSLGASAVQAAGGLALIPAAIGGGVLAIGALKIATSGVGKAISDAFDPTKAKAFQKDLEALTPPARDFVLQVQGMGPALNALQTSTATAFFAGLGAQIRPLGAIYLPILTSGFVGMAGAMNRAILALSRWLQSSFAIGAVNTLVTYSVMAFDNLMAAVAPLAGAFVTIGAIGAPILAQLTAGAGGVAGKFAAWVGSAQGIQTINAWIWQAIAVIQQLWQLAVNVGSILGSMFTAGAASGESFLGTLVRITGQIATALRTPEGAAQLTAVLAGIRDVVGMVWDKLVQLWPAISAVGSAMWALLQAASPVTSLFFSMLVPAVTALANVIGWLAPVLGPLIAGMLALSAVSKVMAIAAAAQSLAVGALRGGLLLLNGVMLIVRGATLVWAAAQVILDAAMSPLVLTILAVVAVVAILAAAVYLIITNWSTIAGFFTWLWGVVSNAFITAWNAIWSFLTMVWNSIWGTAVAIWNQVVAFFTGIWTGISTAAVTAWNAIVSFLTAVWNSIWGTAVAIWNQIVGFFTGIWNSIWNIVMTVWNAIAGWLQAMFIVHYQLWMQIWGAIVGFFTAIWTWIRDIAINAWNAISGFFIAAFNAFVAFFTMIWNGIVAEWTMIWNWISSVAITVWNAISAFFVAAFNAFVAFFTMIWNGIVAFFTMIWNWISSTAVNAWNALVAFLMPAINAFSAFFQMVWNAIVSFFTMIWNWISTTAINAWNALVGFLMPAINAFSGFFQMVWNGISSFFGMIWGAISNTATAVWNQISGFFTGAFNAFVGFFSGIWNGIRDTFARVWNSIRDTAVNVWNGIVGVVKGAVNGVIDAANWMTDKINVVLRFLLIPTIPAIPRLEAGGIIGMARGGRLGARPEYAARGTRIGGGFVTDGPRVIVGEGKRTAPEYVIPTDPAYRGRALALHASLTADLGLAGGQGAAGMDPMRPGPGTPGLAGGGILGWIGNAADWVWQGITAAASAVGGALADVAQWTVGGSIMAMKQQIIDAVNSMVPGGLLHGAAGSVAGKVIDAVKAKIDSWVAPPPVTAGPSGAMPSGNLAGWINTALAMTGTPANWVGPLNTLIQRESGGNPRAINLTDSNAAKGTPSMGLMQTIGPTFSANRDPRLPNDPYDPVANIVAGINYIKRRYGTIFNVQQAVGATPKGYDVGGVASGSGFLLKQTVNPERVLSPRQTAAFESLVPMLSQMRRGASTYSASDFAALSGRDPRSGATINVYPSERMDETQLAQAALHRLDWQMGLVTG